MRRLAFSLPLEQRQREAGLLTASVPEGGSEEAGLSLGQRQRGGWPSASPTELSWPQPQQEEADVRLASQLLLNRFKPLSLSYGGFVRVHFAWGKLTLVLLSFALNTCNGQSRLHNEWGMTQRWRC